MNRAQGFSLIEMLVVMTIMGLVVSVVSLSTGPLSGYFGQGRDASAEALADELMVLMATASSQAILSGEPVALAFAPSANAAEGVAVSWLRYGRVTGGAVRDRRASWQPVSAQTGLREVHVPAAVSNALYVEGEPVDLQALAGSAGLPVMVFYPTGETTGFTWSLGQGEQTVTLTNAITGEIARSQP